MKNMVFTHKWILTIKSIKIMLQSPNLENLNKERVYGVCMDLPGKVKCNRFCCWTRGSWEWEQEDSGGGG